MHLKRTMDVTCALLLVSATAPLMIGIALAELWEGGPIFYTQQRLGWRGRRFALLKFRSMQGGAEGVRLTVGRDPRITRLGRVLRRAKLDELPQLVNVLRGDMSLVGPRPEVPEYLDDSSEPAHRAILAHRPGITDPASLVFWNEAELLARASDPERYYRTTLLPAKHRLSLDYARGASLWTDLLVIGWTACGVLGLVTRGSLPTIMHMRSRPSIPGQSQEVQADHQDPRPAASEAARLKVDLSQG